MSCNELIFLAKEYKYYPKKPNTKDFIPNEIRRIHLDKKDVFIDFI